MFDAKVTAATAAARMGRLGDDETLTFLRAGDGTAREDVFLGEAGRLIAGTDGDNSERLPLDAS